MNILELSDSILSKLAQWFSLDADQTKQFGQQITTALMLRLFGAYTTTLTEAQQLEFSAKFEALKNNPAEIATEVQTTIKDFVATDVGKEALETQLTAVIADLLSELKLKLTDAQKQEISGLFA
jgi:hypothetical protein